MGTVLKFPTPARQRPSTLTISEDKRGQRVMIFDAPLAVNPATGKPTLAAVIPLRPEGMRERARALYVRASALDEARATWGEAEALYRQALAIDPDLDIAYTNLANIKFRTGSEAEAETLYKKALSLNGSQPEAHYNLGYLYLERGTMLVLAITHLERAIDLDSRFADAHFNLALALEQTTGDGRVRNRVQAKLHWRRYLDLEPKGTWADVARAHLR